jgi:acyl-CoA synthetase (AMP-forming)/AMP-acid ligase II
MGLCASKDSADESKGSDVSKKAEPSPEEKQKAMMAFMAEAAKKGGIHPVTGDPIPPLYANAWAASVAKHADKEVLVFDGPLTKKLGKEPKRFTMKEIDTRANNLAKALKTKYGVKLGERVVTICDNRPELFVLLLACLKSGASFTPLTTDLSPEHETILVDSFTPKVVITNKPDKKFKYPVVELPEYYSHEGGEFDKMETEGDGKPDGDASPAIYQKPNIIFSTSGSTGVPKGVMYSGGLVAAHGVIIKKLEQLGTPLLPKGEQNSTQLLWVPMRGVVGTSVTLMLTAEGVRSVMCDSPDATPLDWKELITKHTITTVCLFGAAMQNFITHLPDGDTLPTISMISYGGSCFPPTLIQQSMKQFPNAKFT